MKSLIYYHIQVHPEIHSFMKGLLTVHVEISSLRRYDCVPCRGSSVTAVWWQPRLSAWRAVGWVTKGSPTEEGVRWLHFKLSGVDLGQGSTGGYSGAQEGEGLSFQSSILSRFKLIGFSQPWTKVVTFHEFSLQTKQTSLYGHLILSMGDVRHHWPRWLLLAAHPNRHA